MRCPHCGGEIDAAAALGRLGGSQRTEAQTAARRENGRKGGRPPKPGSIAAAAYWTRKAEEAEAQGNLTRAAECRAKAGG